MPTLPAGAKVPGDKLGKLAVQGQGPMPDVDRREDGLAQMGLVEADYAWITERLMAVAQRHCAGRVVSCLEGGYHLGALARSVASHVRVLAGV